MAAFSNDTRMHYQNWPGSSNHFPTSRNPQMTPSPSHRFRPTFSPYTRMSPYYSSGPMSPETTPSPAHHFGPIYSTGPRMFFQPQNTYTNSIPMNPEVTQIPAHYIQQQPYYPNPKMYQQPQDSYYNSGPRKSGHFQARSCYQGSNANTRGNSFRGKSGTRRGKIVSAELRPDFYYKKSMVEDPWKNLEPSLWKNEKISEEPSSQPSLAAYLAATFK